MAMPRDQGEVLLQQLNRRRYWRIPMYGGLVLSGIFICFDPSNIITEQVSLLVAILWAIAMSLSSAICLFGAITDQWIGEYAGLPLLSAVLAMYAGAVFLSAHDNGSVFLVAFGLVLASYGFGCFARWMDVREVKKNSFDGDYGKVEACGDR